MKSFILLILGLIALSIGIFFYGVFRVDEQLNTTITGSFPSFIHVLAFSLLTSAVLGSRKVLFLSFYTTPWIWLIINLSFEFMQLFFTQTFDSNDLIAAFLGALSAWSILKVLGQTYSIRVFRKSFVYGMLMSGSILIMGSYDIPEETCSGKPIYMSYDTLRSSVKVEEKELENAGKIYLYQQYLLINEPNLGIHLYDNETKTNPVKVGFVNIPGNLDMAIKGNALYVDSFIDLVVIDFSDITSRNIQVINRKEGVFEYDSYQVFSDYTNFCYDEMDDTKGVIIGKY